MARRRTEAELESAFQGELIVELKALFPGCIVLKNDANYQQGIPDLSVFWGQYWAFLEVKAAWNSDRQPNQDYFIDLAEQYSFGAFIFPENKDIILANLQQAFGAGR